MAEEKKSNLEPIEEDDLDLKGKFLGGKTEHLGDVLKEDEGAKIEEIHNASDLESVEKKLTDEKPTMARKESVPVEKKPEIVQSNLEPIDDGELDLKNKFLGGKTEHLDDVLEEEARIEEIHSVDSPVKKPEEKSAKETATEPISEPVEKPIGEMASKLQEKPVEKIAEAKIEEIRASSLETAVEAPVSANKETEQGAERKEESLEREDSYSKILSKVSAAKSAVTGSDVGEDAEIVSREQDLEGKINNLVNLAELKGIAHAVEVARHLEDNYILDELHDRLLGEELHKALVAKGMIKEI